MAIQNRKQKVEELLADLRSVRRSMAFRVSGFGNLPRVTPSQWGVLMIIEHQRSCTVKDVAKALGVTSSAATQLIDGLVMSGYLLREITARDRRTITLTLSKKSKNQVDQMKSHALQKFLNAFKVLTDSEFNQYCALSKKIAHRQ